MNIGERIATEALALVGVPFRLHGRTPDTGLDCVGLAALAAVRAAVHIGTIPSYRLRGAKPESIAHGLTAAGFVAASGGRAGDILVARTGPMQAHLMILTDRGLVHAHAGLGRVVLMPAPSPWPILGQWRCAAADMDERG